MITADIQGERRYCSIYQEIYGTQMLSCNTDIFHRRQEAAYSRQRLEMLAESSWSETQA